MNSTFKKLLSSALSIGMLSLASSANAADNPKYIFYFIGDGMGMGEISIAQGYLNALYGPDSLMTMMQFPVASMSFTYSASSPVTDSAAAGTALASGNKTKNGMLGMNADTIAVPSIARILKDNGFGVGLVTTVAPDDATPGAFYTHVPRRSMFYEIGKDAAASGYDFIAGANLRGTTDKDGNPNDLLDIFEQNQVSVVRGIDALSTAIYDKVLLLNTRTEPLNDVGYTIDSIPDVLTLPAMTQACLSHLMSNSPERFFMMVEGGSIDHAGHANDAATNVMEVLAFDESLQIAYQFYLQHPDETLIVVTADHETGGMALANNHLGYTANLQYLKYPKMSKTAFSEWCHALLKSRRVYTWDDMKTDLSEKLGLYSQIPVTERQNAELEEKFEKTFSMRNSDDQRTMYHNFNEFAVAVFKVISDASGCGWTSFDHSGAVVPVFAIGIDANKFSAVQNNIQIPRTILSIAGYDGLYSK